MLMRRMMARIGFTSIVSLLLSSCSFDDPLASHLASLGRSGHAFPVTESITLEELDQSGLSFRSCAHTLRIKQSKKHLWLMIPLFQNTASPITKTSSFLEERATANNG